MQNWDSDEPSQKWSSFLKWVQDHGDDSSRKSQKLNKAQLSWLHCLIDTGQGINQKNLRVKS